MDAVDLPPVELISYDRYDFSKAKEHSSLLWIISQAYGDDIPKGVQNVYYEDSRDEGKERVKPYVVTHLTNGVIYAYALSHIFGDPNLRNLGLSDVIHFVGCRGFPVRDDEGNMVPNTSLLSSAPIKLGCHVHLIDCLMRMYLRHVTPVDKIQVSVKYYTLMHRGDDIPKSIEEALIFWVNKICSMVKLEHKIASDSWPHDMKEVQDLENGINVAFLIHFYCPDTLNLNAICFSDRLNNADMVYNWCTIKQFCKRYIPNPVYHFANEDVLYCHGGMERNLIVFLAELFYYFNVKPIACVKPIVEDITNTQKVFRSARKMQPTVSDTGSPSKLPFGSVSRLPPTQHESIHVPKHEELDSSTRNPHTTGVGTSFHTPSKAPSSNQFAVSNASATLPSRNGGWSKITQQGTYDHLGPAGSGEGKLMPAVVTKEHRDLFRSQINLGDGDNGSGDFSRTKHKNFDSSSSSSYESTSKNSKHSNVKLPQVYNNEQNLPTAAASPSYLISASAQPQAHLPQSMSMHTINPAYSTISLAPNASANYNANLYQQAQHALSMQQLPNANYYNTMMPQQQQFQQFTPVFQNPQLVASPTIQNQTSPFKSPVRYKRAGRQLPTPAEEGGYQTIPPAMSNGHSSPASIRSPDYNSIDSASLGRNRNDMLEMYNNRNSRNDHQTNFTLLQKNSAGSNPDEYFAIPQDEDRFYETVDQDDNDFQVHQASGSFGDEHVYDRIGDAALEFESASGDAEYVNTTPFRSRVPPAESFEIVPPGSSFQVPVVSSKWSDKSKRQAAKNIYPQSPGGGSDNFSPQTSWRQKQAESASMNIYDVPKKVGETYSGSNSPTIHSPRMQNVRRRLEEKRLSLSENDHIQRELQKSAQRRQMLNTDTVVVRKVNSDMHPPNENVYDDVMLGDNSDSASYASSSRRRRWNEVGRTQSERIDANAMVNDFPVHQALDERDLSAARKPRSPMKVVVTPQRQRGKSMENIASQMTKMVIAGPLRNEVENLYSDSDERSYEEQPTSSRTVVVENSFDGLTPEEQKRLDFQKGQEKRMKKMKENRRQREEQNEKINSEKRKKEEEEAQKKQQREERRKQALAGYRQRKNSETDASSSSTFGRPRMPKSQSHTFGTKSASTLDLSPKKQERCDSTVTLRQKTGRGRPRPISSYANSKQKASDAPTCSGSSTFKIRRSSSSDARGSSSNLGTLRRDADIKLYKQPVLKSNKALMLNAVRDSIFPGPVDANNRSLLQDAIKNTEGSHYVILFRDQSRCLFRGLYIFKGEQQKLYKAYGIGPGHVTNEMVERFYKYSSGAKQFKVMNSIKHFSIQVDAFTLEPELWKKR